MLLSLLFAAIVLFGGLFLVAGMAGEWFGKRGAPAAEAEMRAKIEQAKAARAQGKAEPS
jgi:hypothetical protein